MVYQGHVKNGMVVLDEQVRLPEGAVVRVELSDQDETAKGLWEGLLALAGTVEGMPSDMARNHDHYLYGTPKK